MQTIQKLDGILADPKLKLRLRRVPLENPIGDPLFSKLVSHWFILGQYGNLNFRIDLHQG